MQVEDMDAIILPDSALPLNFQQRPPHYRLRRWVQCLWSLGGGDAGASRIEKLYPDGGASLTIHLDKAQPDITLCFNKHTLVETLDASTARMGVRFKPAGMHCLMGLAADAHVDFYHRLESATQPAWLASLMPIIDSLYPLDSPAGMNLLESWLLGLLNGASNIQSRLPLLVDTLSTSKLLPDQLGAYLGFTRRTLERKLKREVGASPSQLVNFARLHRARHALIETKRPLADIALGCGFHDQAHFTHAFKKFALETPSVYRQRKLSQSYKA
ncbi:helix-turn-helix domain-containing protein [Vreelandella sp. EE7]